MGVIWEILYPETAVQKDFSQKSMVSPENAFKKIPLKVHYLANEQEWIFFDFFGLFSKAFSGETIDFCEKSFYTAVSRYNISHMTPMTHTFEKKEQL